MTRFVVLATLALLAPFVAGCLGGDDDPVSADATEPAVNGTARAVEGAPVAPTTAFTVEADGERREIHPYVVPGQEAREPVAHALAGEFAPEDCKGPVSWIAGKFDDFHDLTDLVRAGDAVDATITMRYEKPSADALELHLYAGAPGQGVYWEEPVGDATGEIVQELRFQFGFPQGDGMFYAGVDCWESWATEPVAYSIDVALVFAEGVVPAGTPHLAKVSTNVTELRVSGAPATPGETVTGHYRLFAPDDSLVGEFALNSDEAYDAVPVPTPGDYVIIVDHSEGGMLALGANAPPADPGLLALEADWTAGLVWESASPGPASATVTMEVPRVPLFIVPWSESHPNSVGGGKKVVIDLDSPKGRVWHRQLAAEVGVEAENFGFETGIPGVVDEWSFEYDHHALAVGTHTFTIGADFYHGRVYYAYVTYLRPGETGVPVPSGGADGESALDASAALKTLAAVRRA